MSGTSVLDSVALIISILNASINLFDSSLKGFDLSERFNAVRRRLPVVVDAFQACKNEFEPVKDSIPPEFCNSLYPILSDCEEKACKMGMILEKIRDGESHAWEKRYSSFIRTFDSVETIEALMKSIAEYVKSIHNAHKVLAADSKRNVELDKAIGEMKSLMAFSFQKPFGICLGRATFLSTNLFVGRDDGLASLTNVLNSSLLTSELQRVVLGGVRGVGKTQLAFAYADRDTGGYESAFWLNAASEDTLRQSFKTIYDYIFLGVCEERPVIKTVHDWLSDTANSRWLLIFDGYNDPNKFNIEDYYPPASHGAIIVTTRQPALVKGITIDVQPLQKLEDSISILQNRSQRENVQSDHHARLLAERLAGLPLDLTIAGAYLRNSTFSFERYLQEYVKRQNCNLDPYQPVKLPDYTECTF